MTIPHFFVEGNTETKVLEKLKLIEPVAVKQEPGGKDDINKRMIDVLGPKLGVETIRCLVMRDLDSHVGETSDGIRNSVEQTLRRLFDERGLASQGVVLSPHEKHENVYVFQEIDPNIRVALHIATYCCLNHFIKSTVDDYVLSLAHAQESDIQEVFAPLLAAAQFLSDDPVTV